MADIQERTLPHNLEAERSILGACLLHTDALLLATDFVKAQFFFRDAHRRIFDAMVELSEKHVTVDLVTLKDHLTKIGELDTIGGPAYVSALLDGVPRSMNVEHYAGIVREAYRKREIIFTTNKLLAAAYEGQTDSEELLKETDAQLAQLDVSQSVGELTDLTDFDTRMMEELERRVRSQSSLRGISTGFDVLDEVTLGLHPGELVILAARPSMGKTALAMNIVRAVSAQEKVCAVFSLEMSKPQLETRMLSAESGVPHFRLQNGKLDDADWPKLSMGINDLKHSPIYIDDTAVTSVIEMRAKCRQLRAKRGLSVVLIDYLQLIESAGGTRQEYNRTLELARISRRLKTLSKELGITVLALSQLSRAPEGRASRRPRLSDLRESGALEQDADTVLFIHQEGDSDTAVDGPAELIVGKQRNGPTGALPVEFDRRCVRFLNARSTENNEVQDEATAVAQSFPDMAPESPRRSSRARRK